MTGKAGRTVPHMLPLLHVLTILHKLTPKFVGTHVYSPVATALCVPAASVRDELRHLAFRDC
jgi:hypothetical protein